jgi:hypothetical protein
LSQADAWANIPRGKIAKRFNGAGDFPEQQ